MAVHQIKKGLDLPITGAPKQEISDGESVTSIALVADDYPFMKPKMAVEEGDEVKIGQLLFEDRKTDGVRFTSPGAGKVVAINRGERRALQSVVIELASDEEQVKFDTSKKKDGESLRELLAESGLWTAFRARPFNKVPSPSETCSSIFVTAIDTNPLAASPDAVLEGREDDWQAGIDALTKLTEGSVWVCTRGGSSISASGKNVKVESFNGPHPSGLVGTHIHMLDPVGPGKTVWHIGYQDVIAIGSFLKTGKLDLERVISLAGPGVKEPRLVRTRLGANTVELTDGQLKDGEIRVVSGSILYGHKASDKLFGYLGRYHTQISGLAEDRERVFFGWLRPGGDRFSIVRTYLSAWLGSKRFDMNTSTNGGHRANVPIGSLERVMPLDIMPTFLIRALLAGDIERAEQLGALELDEEDLALCTFVSPGKEDFGVALRKTLTTIWKEG